MLLGIIGVIIFLSILVLVHELGHFLAAKKFGLFVEEFGVGLPPRLWGKRVGETIYSVNALPFGGFVKIFGEDESREEIHRISDRKRNFAFLSPWKRAVILLAGVFMNFILGWIIVSIIFMIGIPGGVFITDVRLGSPAAEAGVMAGDKVLSIETNQEKLESDLDPDNFSQFIKGVFGREVLLKIERSGETKDFRLMPRVNPPLGEGPLGIVLIESGLPKSGILKSLWTGLKTSAEISFAVLRAIINLVAGVFNRNYADLASITGPVGIIKISAEAGRLGFVHLLQLLALISLNLATLNALPFPALDGGRLLFLIIEKIKGSPLSRKFERYANGVGMAFLLALMALVTIKDIAGLI